MAKAAKQAAAKASPSTPKAAGKAAKSPKGAEKATKSVEKTAKASKHAEKQASTSKVPPPKAAEEAEDDDDEEDEDFVDVEDGSDEDVSGSDAGSDDDESDSDDEGVDEEGMERLMKLLGDDGLDEYDQAQLSMMLGGDDESGSEEEEEEEEGEDDSDEEADSDSEETAAGPSATKPQEADDDAIPLDEVEDEVDEDAVPQRKLEIDNTVALERIRDTIQLDPSLPWTETLVLSYPNTIDVDVDVEDDLNRELAFYKQALHGANAARALAAKHNFPFTRPADYFAEMVKSDAHMERIRQRLLDEKAAIKKSEDKRREREGKKFGKQVQIEKLKEREQSKKDMEERLRSLKRKHKDVLDKPVDDDFDVAVEDAIADRPAKRGKPNGPKMARSARDKKFGYGTVGRRAKQNTKESTDNFDFGGGKGGKGGPAKGGKKGFKPQRPGKSRRHAMKR
ncbi:eukaryotic rRNA processing protein EBP2-domain-containing protein [Schizophyllum commune]